MARRVSTAAQHPNARARRAAHGTCSATSIYVPARLTSRASLTAWRTASGSLMADPLGMRGRVDDQVSQELSLGPRHGQQAGRRNAIVDVLGAILVVERNLDLVSAHVDHREVAISLCPARRGGAGSVRHPSEASSIPDGRRRDQPRDCGKLVAPEQAIALARRKARRQLCDLSTRDGAALAAEGPQRHPMKIV
jgi:hypothetical protein